jgi:hypothetical protein
MLLSGCTLKPHDCLLFVLRGWLSGMRRILCLYLIYSASHKQCKCEVMHRLEVALLCRLTEPVHCNLFILQRADMVRR